MRKGVIAISACLIVVSAFASPASAATSFGADLSLAPSGSGSIGVVSVATVAHADGSVEAGSPISGVLTSVSVRSNGLANDGVVRVLRLTAHPDVNTYSFLNMYSGMSISLPADPSSSGTVTTIPTRVAIQAGDRLGLQLPADGGYTTNVQHIAAGLAKCAFTGGGHAVGTTLDYSIALCGDYELLIRGVVEPDADGDWYGDETQDACPADAALQVAPCTADVSVAVSSSKPLGRDKTRQRVAFSVYGLGPSTATNVTLQITKPYFVGSLSVTGCTLSADRRTCTIPSLAAGAEQRVTITVRSKRAKRRLSKHRNLSLRLTGLDQTDTNATNNDAVNAFRLRFRRR